MRRLGEELLTLAVLGILASFLSLLFVASVRGRTDGRKIPFPSVLGESGCYVSGCHLTAGSTLNEVGSVSFNNLPTSFVPGETYDLGITMAGGSIYGFQLAAVFSDDTQAGSLTAVTEDTIVEMVGGGDNDHDHDHDNGHDEGHDDDYDEEKAVQILTHARPLVANSVDFQWTAPMVSGGGSVLLKVATNSANGDSSARGDAINTLEASIRPDAMTTFVPVVLDSSGRNNSHFTSELALTNRGSEAAMLNFTYTADKGGGSGTATGMLGPHQQMIASNAIDYLRSLDLPIPETGKRVGTLRVDVSGSSDVSAVVRTTTPTAVPEGSAGLAYLGVPEHEGFHEEVVYLCGLRDNPGDRSNVAVQNMGSDGSITVRITAFSGDPEDDSGKVAWEDTLGPGEFHQVNTVLTRAGKADPMRGGYVKVERVEGMAPFYAYGVINDNVNSDGSFVFPVSAASLEGAMGQTLPALVESGAFTTELTLTNVSAQPKVVMFRATHERIEAEKNTAGFGPVPMLPGQQLIIPQAMAYARQNLGLDVPMGLVVPLMASPVAGDLSGVVIGARVVAPADPEDRTKGQYGVFYTAVPQGQGFTTSACVDGLQQNEENRGNLALVNTGEADDRDIVFEIDIYDGETATLSKTVTMAEDGNLVVPAKGFKQINQVLKHAPGTMQGYIRIRRVSGANPFLAYGVVNDGGTPGERTGDGAYIPARE
jgi:hypothetical protein